MKIHKIKSSNVGKLAIALARIDTELVKFVGEEEQHKPLSENRDLIRKLLKTFMNEK